MERDGLRVLLARLGSLAFALVGTTRIRFVPPILIVAFQWRQGLLWWGWIHYHFDVRVGLAFLPFMFSEKRYFR